MAARAGRQQRKVVAERFQKVASWWGWSGRKFASFKVQGVKMAIGWPIERRATIERWHRSRPVRLVALDWCLFGVWQASSNLADIACQATMASNRVGSMESLMQKAIRARYMHYYLGTSSSTGRVCKRRRLATGRGHGRQFNQPKSRLAGWLGASAKG